MATLIRTIPAGGGSLTVPGYPSSVVTASSGVTVDGNALTASVPFILDGGDSYLTFSTAASADVTVTYTATTVPSPNLTLATGDARYAMLAAAAVRNTAPFTPQQFVAWRQNWTAYADGATTLGGITVDAGGFVAQVSGFLPAGASKTMSPTTNNSRARVTNVKAGPAHAIVMLCRVGANRAELYVGLDAAGANFYRVKSPATGDANLTIEQCVSSSLNSTFAQGRIGFVPLTGGSYVWVRVEMGNGMVRAKTWALGTSEPVHYQVTAYASAMVGQPGFGGVYTDATTKTVFGSGSAYDLSAAGYIYVAIGDSITAANGTGGGGTVSYMNYMEADAGNSLGRRLIANNQGVGGATTALWTPGNGSGYLTAAKAAAAGGSPPYKLATIMLGVNDGSPSQGPVSAATYEANMRLIVNDLVTSGFVVVMYPPTFVGLGVATRTAESVDLYLNQYPAALDRIAADTPALYAGQGLGAATQARPDLKVSDGVHFTDPGEAFIGAYAAPSFADVLSRSYA